MNFKTEALHEAIPDLDKFVVSLEKDDFPNYPRANYAHFVTFLKLNDYTMFTQDGQTAMTKETWEDLEGSRKITRGVMFQRKITAALRRKCMEILRTHAADVMEHTEGKLTEIKGINRLTPDASLFGFAVGDSDDNKKIVAFAGKSRVLTGSAFTIRSMGDDIADYINFSSQSDKTRIEEASGALGEKEFINPEVYFPTIITLRDPTAEDILFMTHIIDETRRFGASSSRGGRGDLQICGLYLSHSEFPSNLELSKAIYGKLEDKDEMFADGELCSRINDIIQMLCERKRVHFHFTSHDALMSAYQQAFTDDDAIDDWIKRYSMKYYEILAYLDLKNAGLNKGEEVQEKKIQDRVAELEELL